MEPARGRSGCALLDADAAATVRASQVLTPQQFGRAAVQSFPFFVDGQALVNKLASEGALGPGIGSLAQVPCSIMLPLSLFTSKLDCASALARPCRYQAGWPHQTMPETLCWPRRLRGVVLHNELHGTGSRDTTTLRYVAAPQPWQPPAT